MGINVGYLGFGAFGNCTCTARGSGIRSYGFAFTISWATNVPVVVEASANLANPVWVPLRTNALTGGWSYFFDPKWTNYPSRFYRVRSQ